MAQPREFKPKTPLSLVVKAAVIALLVVGFVILAIYQTGAGLREARKTGTVTSKEFVPAAHSEQQITLSTDGTMAARTIEGEFLITVEVPGPGGSRKPYRVWLPDRASYDAVAIGDRFDVGPYLVK